MGTFRKHIKVQVTGFAVARERKRGVTGEFEVFGLSNSKNGLATYCTWEEDRIFVNLCFRRWVGLVWGVGRG